MPFCINCDNRHGCKSGMPACLKLPREADEKTLRGRELMAKRGLLTRCQNCNDFRICWRRDQYDAALAKARREGTCL